VIIAAGNPPIAIKLSLIIDLLLLLYLLAYYEPTGLFLMEILDFYLPATGEEPTFEV
jgi:hypothetical protein